MQIGLSTAQPVYITSSASKEPVRALAPLESATEHDASVCALCLAGAVHAFSADGDETVVSAAAQRAAGTSQGPAPELTTAEIDQVRRLAARDREVRAHEQAHLAAAGGYATGGPAYSYQTGPDGARYAVGGEVSIDTSPVPGNPRATLAKARTIAAAANAPAEPSGQDRAVASAAAQMAARAQAEIAQAVAVAQYAGNRGSAPPTVDVSY